MVPSKPSSMSPRRVRLSSSAARGEGKGQVLNFTKIAPPVER